MRVGISIACVFALAACVGPAATTCEDGFVCSAEQVCAPAGGGCVDPAQVAACIGVGPGDSCALDGIGVGTCVDEVCVLGGCGNGTPEPGEACDDGNTRSGDGCRADCAKVEVCGDAVVDEGEACDDANGNTADGCDACAATTWGAEALLRGAVPGTEVGLATPMNVAVDRAGNVYIADTENHRIRRVDGGSGVITTVAGTGAGGDGGDGGPATSARLAFPAGVAVDGAGNVFVADTNNHRIRRVDGGSGVITTVAGTGTRGASGDGGPGTSASLRFPHGVAVDGAGNVYVADTENHRIRRVDGDSGVITAMAGTGAEGFSGDGGPATSASLAVPRGVAVDGAGNVYVADLNNHRIRRVDGASGVITTAAGTGAAGFSGDGGPATSASLRFPFNVAVDEAGNVYVADTENQRVRRVDAGSGEMTTVAGSGGFGFGGDGGPATSASFRYPWGVAVDRAGTVYVADGKNHRIRRVDGGSGEITTVAGSGAYGFSGDGGAATSARMAAAYGVAVDGAGNVYIADWGSHRIRRADGGSAEISTVAGTGEYGFDGDEVSATSANLAAPHGVAVDGAGNVFIADTQNHRIRRVDAGSGEITTVAGTGAEGASGDGGPATSASLRFPFSVAVDGAGNLYVADTNNHLIRRVDGASGVITTVAGTGAQGGGGDGGPATSASLSYPTAVAVDGVGNVYVADTENHRIRRVDGGSGVITTVAGTGAEAYGGDGGPATSASLAFPAGVAVDGAGNVYVTDTENHRLRRVDGGSGVITTVAGTGAETFGGDEGPATSARLAGPRGVTVDGAGNVYVADYKNGRIRRVDGGSGVIATVAGAVWPEGEGPQAQAALATPQALWFSADLSLLAGGATGVVQALRSDEGKLETVAGRYPQSDAIGDRALFRAQSFGSVGGVAYDAVTKRIYLTEGHVVHAVTTDDAGAGVVPDDEATWTIAVLAGAAGIAGSVDGSVASARFRAPSGLYFDQAARVLYVADAGNHAIRAIDVDGGVVTTVAGTPATLGYFGDGGAATDALLYAPSAITLAPNGDLFIADRGNHRVRRVTAGSGVITTVLGDGVAASSGEGTPADTFPVDDPQGLACDAYGNLFVSSSTTVRFLPASDEHVVDGTGPVQTIYGAAPRATFPALATSCLTGVAVVDAATTWVTDRCAGLLVELWRQPVAP